MTKKQIILLAGLIVGVILIALFVHSRLLDRIADTDGFYHIRHAWIYQTSGLLQSAFPWAQFSIIKTHMADLWYGFHVLLIPLTYFENLLTGIRLGSILITISALLLVYWSLKRLDIRWPFLWLFVFTFATADLLYRLTMLRPHPLSLGLALLLFAFLNVKIISRGVLALIFIFAAAFSWIHISLSWLPILIAVVILLVELLSRIKISFPKYIILGLGIISGVLLRPNPFGGIKLAYIQVIQLIFEKQNAPLRFGRELIPFYWENFVDQLIPLVFLVLVALSFLIWVFIKNRTRLAASGLLSPILSSLILASIFSALTFAVARRSNEIFVGFTVIFIGLVFTYYIKNLKPSWGSNLVIIFSILMLIYMPAKTIFRFDTYATNAFLPERFKEASEWLSENSQPGQTVLNIHWDRFAQLFFWNPSNHYINGMDPIFQYVYDPASYWKLHFYSINASGAFTCDMIRCEIDETIPTPEAVEDFGASYILVEQFRSPKVFQYFENAVEFQKVFENEQETIFKTL